MNDIFFKPNSVYAVRLQCTMLFVYLSVRGTLCFVVEYLATQTGGATVNNIFEVRFTYIKIDELRSSF